jgi:hypothetical protein
MYMKTLLIALALVSVTQVANAADVNNSNNTIVVKPNIIVKTGCCTSCKPKTKVVEKIVTVEKVVEKVVEKPVDRVIVVERKVLVQKKQKKQKKNRVSLMGGIGPSYLSYHGSNQVDLERGAVGGAMYQRLVTDSVSLGVQVQTNQTVLGTVGLDF